MKIVDALEVIEQHLKCLRKEYCPMDCNDCDLEMVPMDTQAEALETILKYMEADLK